ncbi:MAG: nuclear transport factor 2 family protein [Marmoricola sp.]
MTEHEQVGRRREYLAAFERGDMDSVRGFFSDDVVWHVAGSHPLSGDYRGTDALIDYFTRVRAEADLTFEPLGILANDRHVASFLRIRGTRAGKTLDIESCDMLRVGPDGRWEEFWSMPDDQASVNEFWRA